MQNILLGYKSEEFPELEKEDIAGIQLTIIRNDDQITFIDGFIINGYKVPSNKKTEVSFLSGKEILFFGLPRSSSSIIDESKMGGIDLARTGQFNYTQAGFVTAGLDLPVLSQAQLERIDTDEELRRINDMVQAELRPSPKRIEELVAACKQKGVLTQSLGQLVRGIVSVFDADELVAAPTDPALIAALRGIEQ